MKAFLFTLMVCGLFACNNPVSTSDNAMSSSSKDSISAAESFSHDVQFLQKYKDIVVLQQNSMRVLIVPGFQARVMTSSAGGDNGLSYGWINYSLIDSGKLVPHMNAFGGEERFWLGPEGGQYALFFKKGDPFDFTHWQTPAVIDTVTYDLVSKNEQEAVFTKSFTLENYTGTPFSVTVNRHIQLLEENHAEALLGVSLKGLKWVGYQSTNELKNTGASDWSADKGLLSVWLLSMLRSSPSSTIIVPYKTGGADAVNDAYFGKIPAERLRKKDSFLLLTADAKYRGKIGVPPSIVKPIAGSYDSAKQVLTIIQFDYKGDTSYVNSMWEQQKFPYKGDVINAYNDGPNATGSQLGAFYELETSSPAMALKKNQSVTHTQRIFHLEGDKELLNKIAKQLLGADLGQL